ncbi:MAG: PEGA domain-containing protein [Myxococcales bacterium]|nr:PEGA domain-containing protein [Myxococcales bacterium]
MDHQLTYGSRIMRGRTARAMGLFVAVTLALGPALDAHARRKRPRRARKVKKKTTVEIMSMTRGATIFLDDKKIGVVPMEDPIVVTPGAPHVIRLQKRGFTPFVDTVRLKAGEQREVEADLVPSGGILKLACNIRRAQVLLDGKPIGRTPFDGDVPPGKHKLEVVAAGKMPSTQVIDIRAGKLVSLTIKLKDIPAPVVKKDKSLFGKWWFWSAVGAAVLGGATAAALATREVQVNPPAPNLTLNIGGK